MADRVYPSAKPNPPPAAAAASANGGAAAAGSFPAPKSQMYERPIYHPPAPSKRRRGRSSCRCNFCCCFGWSLLVVLLLALLAAVAGGAFYLLYRPQRPSFAVSSVRLAKLNLTTAPTTTLVTSAVTLTVTARNPNRKVVYLYDDFTLSASTSANGVPLGTATVPGFAHQAGNTTVLSVTLAADAVAVDPTAAGSDIKRSGSFAVALDAETHAGVSVGSIRTKRIGIQVHCEGIKVTPPQAMKPAVTVKLTKTKGKKANSTTAVHAPAPAPSPSADVATTPAPAPTSDDDTATVSAHSCMVRVRVKIWRWTF